MAVARQEVFAEQYNGFNIWVCEPCKGDNRRNFIYETPDERTSLAATLEEAREKIGGFGEWKINPEERLKQAMIGLLLMIMTDSSDVWVRDNWERIDDAERQDKLDNADVFLFYRCDLRWNGEAWIDQRGRSVFHATAEITEIITRLIEGSNE